MTEFKLTLLENSYSFLNHSLSEAIVAEEYPENWKYAILHLVQAIELSLKELLRLEHPILIYKNIDRPNETVSLEFAASRLQDISKIKFKKEDLEAIKLASQYRNQIVHYEFSFKAEEIKSIFAKLIGFLQSFINTHYHKNLSDIIEDEVWKEAIKIIDYATELHKRALDRFLEEKIESTLVMECRHCHQDAFVFKDDINSCYVCGNIDEVGKCNDCGEFFYIDELVALHEYDDSLHCRDCRQIIQNSYLGSDFDYS